MCIDESVLRTKQSVGSLWNRRLVSSFVSAFLLGLSGFAVAEPVVVAHRGASIDAPENTIPAFELAWEQGADAIEADFRLTKDLQIVCIHDGDTKKVAGKNLKISTSNLKDLKALDVGSFRGKQFVGVRIPTFEEVLAIVPDGKKIYIEIKCGPEILPIMFKQLGDSGLGQDQMVFISFEKLVIQALKKHQPACRAYWLYSFKRNKPELDELLVSLKEIGADGLSSNIAIPDQFVKGVQAAGYEWHVWTINNKAQAERVKGLGAVSITTDMPGVLKQ